MDNVSKKKWDNSTKIGQSLGLAKSLLNLDINDHTKTQVNELIKLINSIEL